MPTTPNHTIFVIGSGSTPDALLKAELNDVVESSPSAPTVEFLAVEGREAVSLEIAKTYVEESWENVPVSWLLFPSETALENHLSRHPWLPEGDEVLLVFWDEYEGTTRAAKLALSKGMRVFDLSGAMAKVGGFTQDKYYKETEMTATAYAQTDLEQMSPEELTAIAESLGIEHESIGTWEEVIAAILGEVPEEQAYETPADFEEADEAEDAEEVEEDASEGGYTRAELEALSLEVLKEICAANEIAVEGQRPRAARYIQAILDAQGGEVVTTSATSTSASAQPAEEDGEIVSETAAAAELLTTVLSLVEVLSEGVADSTAATKAALQAIHNGFSSVSLHLKDISSRLEKLEAKSVAPVVQIPEPPTKAAPATTSVKPAAPAVKRLVRRIPG